MLKKFLAVAVVVGCGDSMSEAPDAGGGGAADASADAASNIMYSGKTFSFDNTKAIDAAVQPPLGGVEICIASGAPVACTTSDVEGDFALSVPKNVKGLRLTYRAAGHAPAQVLTFTDDVDRMYTLFMMRDAVASAFNNSCNAQYPDPAGTGSIMVQGYRYTPPTYQYLDGAVATGPGVGPCYSADPVYTHDPQRLTTLAAGAGVVVFANVPSGSGTADVTVTLAGTTCKAFRDLAPSPSPNTMRVPVLEGFITSIDVVCE